MINLTIGNREYLSGSLPPLTTYQVSVTIICKPGYKWADNFLQKTITCQPSGSWTFIEKCVGKFHNMFHNMFHYSP